MVAEKVCYSLVSDQGFDIETRWASGAVFGLRMGGEIGSGRPISDPGLLQSVKELLDEFLSSGGIAAL
jgi:hypothetical protein